ncbi:nucleoside diphosphate-linked moiety X motif 17 isoform X2 [Varanus komodoensis]|uniref:nucleoside diphosphate-linked moiety X motif 17 isoform X2 n=1 Tax=Varanus komodoensis TaxID=61221 RepID=UPI001CF79720|nr:nucleoside diphosphate-linked moiety X motif 17 isoform X2 [Varanus komodoensis]
MCKIKHNQYSQAHKFICHPALWEFRREDAAVPHTSRFSSFKSIAGPPRLLKALPAACRRPSSGRCCTALLSFQSIVGHFCAAHEDQCVVNCGLDQHRFLISDQAFPGSSRVLLQRPSFCPIKHVSEAQAASLPKETRERGVDVGVAVLLQAASQEVLLTRRSRNMSIFPNLWVPPGGHIEPDEQSTYPPRLSRGLPKRHHVVVYLLLCSHLMPQQLQARMKPDEAEVSAYAWLEPHLLEVIAATEDRLGDGARKTAGALPPTISITELDNGVAKSVAVPGTTFLNSAPAEGEDVERVSTGTKFALRLWLDTVAAQTA